MAFATQVVVVFDDTFDFTVPAGCDVLVFEWDQHTDFCVRLYDIEITP